MNFLQKIGAINNIVRRPDGTLTAFNTDYIGAISAIEDGLRGISLPMLLFCDAYYVSLKL